MEKILQDLSQKKLGLLKQLLVETQLWLLKQSEEAFGSKQKTLADLTYHDQVIEQVEEKLSLLAKDQEKGVYKEIRGVLLQLIELNQEGLQSVERDQQEAENSWKRLVNEGVRMREYVQSAGPYTESRRIKGQSHRRGWQRGYQPHA